MKRNRYQKTCQNDIDRLANVKPVKGDFVLEFVFNKWSKNLSFTSLISMSLKWRAATSPLSLAVLEDLLPVLLLLVYRPCGWHALRSGEGKVHGNAASLSTLATEACNGRFWRQCCNGRITLAGLCYQPLHCIGLCSMTSPSARPGRRGGTPASSSGP